MFQVFWRLTCLNRQVFCSTSSKPKFVSHDINVFQCKFHRVPPDRTRTTNVNLECSYFSAGMCVCCTRGFLFCPFCSRVFAMPFMLKTCESISFRRICVNDFQHYLDIKTSNRDHTLRLWLILTTRNFPCITDTRSRWCCESQSGVASIRSALFS